MQNLQSGYVLWEAVSYPCRLRFRVSYQIYRHMFTTFILMYTQWKRMKNRYLSINCLTSCSNWGWRLSSHKHKKGFKLYRNILREALLASKYGMPWFDVSNRINSGFGALKALVVLCWETQAEGATCFFLCVPGCLADKKVTMHRVAATHKSKKKMRPQFPDG